MLKEKRITRKAETTKKKKQNKSSGNTKKASFSQEARSAARAHIRSKEEKRTEHFSKKVEEKERLVKLLSKGKMREALQVVRDSDHLSIEDMQKMVQHEIVDRKGRGKVADPEKESSKEDVTVNALEDFSQMLSAYTKGGAEKIIEDVADQVDDLEEKLEEKEGGASSKNDLKKVEALRKRIKHLKRNAKDFLEAAGEEGIVQEWGEFFYNTDKRAVGLESTVLAETIDLRSPAGEFLSEFTDDFNVNKAIEVFSAVSDTQQQENDVDLSAEYFIDNDFENLNIEEQALLELKEKNALEAFSEYRAVYKDKKKLKSIERAILDLHWSAVESGRQRRDVMQALRGIRSVIKNFDKKWEQGINSNPELWYTNHILQLRQYRRQLAEGYLAETPYVYEQAERVQDVARTGKPVFISGFHGSGKTMLAEKVARDLYDEINPDEKNAKMIATIAGNEHTTIADFFGQVVLRKPDSIDGEEFDAIIADTDTWYERQVAKMWEVANENLEGLKEDSFEYQEIMDRAMEKQESLTHSKKTKIEDRLKRDVETIYANGPIYRAMEEGKVLIIDEVNGIPHQTLISLNYILAGVRPGDTVPLPDGKEITVQPGFSVIMTGNLGEKYTDREPLDPAFLDRLTQVDYDYLPQSTEGGPDTASQEDELFHVFLSVFTDRYGNFRGPEGTRKKLWELAKVSRYLENNFSGKVEIEIAAEGADLGYTLQKHVPSLRVLMPILQKCARRNFEHSLEHYLYEDFIKKTGDPPEDKETIEQVFGVHTRAYALTDALFNEGWLHKEGGGVTGDSQEDENALKDLEFFHKEEVAEWAFGRAPEHTYVKGKDIAAEKRDQQETKKQEKIEELEEMLDALQKECTAVGCTV